MTQQEMSSLFNVAERTLRDWKKGRRQKLYKLMELLDHDAAQQLLERDNNNDLRKLLENEKHFDSFRDFEQALYSVLVSGRDTREWLGLSKDTTLSKEARSRSAYLYSFLTSKVAKIGFTPKHNIGFFHKNRQETANGLAKIYGLRNGIDVARFNQYKMTGGC